MNISRTAAFCFALLCACLLSVLAHPAELLKDISDGKAPLDASPFNLVPFGNRALFFASDNLHGREIWVTNGTERGTRPLADIMPGAGSSEARVLATVGGQAYFEANDGTNFKELWVTDGTASGTHIVANITPDHTQAPFPSLSNLGAGTAFQGRLYFLYRNPDGGGELWRSNGTEDGTQRIVQFPASNSGLLTMLESYGDRLYFRWHTSAAGEEMWSSDGTAAGTAMVADLNPGPANGTEGDSWLPTDRGVYFRAHDGVHGLQMFYLPAPGASPERVTGVGPDEPSLDAIATATFGENVVVASSDSVADYGITCLAGGIATIVANHGSNLTQGHGRALFAVKDGAELQLWSTDCTAEGTVSVMNLPAASSSFAFVDIGAGILAYGREGGMNRLYFVAAAGDVPQELVLQVPGARAPEMPRGDGQSFPAFVAADGFGYVFTIEYFDPQLPNDFGLPQIGLWRTDGSQTGTSRVAIGFNEPFPFRALLSHGSLLYVPVDDPAHGAELFVSDSQFGDWQLLKDIAQGGTTPPSEPSGGTAFEGYYYFFARDGSGTNFRRTDGTRAGTAPIDLGGVIPDSSTHLAVVGRRAVYAGALNSSGFEPRVFDFDTQTESLLLEIGPGQLSGFHGTWRDRLPVVGGRVIFGGHNGIAEGVYVSDGTTAGTTRLLPNGTFSDVAISYWAMLGDDLIFYDYVNNRLWRTDGTPAGTSAFFAPTFDLAVDRMAESDGLVYFTASDGHSFWRQLWRTDGTAAGTFPVTNGVESDIRNITPFGSRTYFRSDCGGVNRCRLWASDGSMAGTLPVTQHYLTGPAPEHPLPIWRDRLWFQGINAAGNPDSCGLYTYDGSVLIHAVPQPASESEQMWPEMVLWNRLIGVSPANNDRYDLWYSNGSAAGTRPLVTFPGGLGVRSDGGFSEPGAINAFGDALIVTADDGIHGSEPWIVRHEIPNANYDAYVLDGAATVALTVLENDSDLDSSLDGATLEIVTPAAAGKAVIDLSSGTISYTPNAGAGGTDEFVYRIQDSEGNLSNDALVAVNIPWSDVPELEVDPPPPPPPPPPPGGGGSGGGGSTDPASLLLLLAAVRIASRGARYARSLTSSA